MDVLKIIPFRLESSRFPQKALASFCGKTLLERMVDIAERIPGDRLVVTAPARDIERVARELPACRARCRFVVTSSECRSATERAVELSQSEPADLYVTLPVDEPLLDPDEVGRILAEHADAFARGGSAHTLWCRFWRLEDARTPLSAKIVVGEHERVLYMSRAMVPLSKSGGVDLDAMRKHVGVFFFPRSFLRELYERADETSRLDRFEGLEQLRWLELGMPLLVHEIRHRGFGVDEPDQLAELEERMRC